MPRTTKPAPEPVPATSTARVRARLERLRELGLTEVRGIMAPAEDHAAIKAYARMLAAEREKRAA